MKTESAISKRLKEVSEKLDKLNGYNVTLNTAEIIATQREYNTLAWVLLSESDVAETARNKGYWQFWKDKVDTFINELLSIKGDETETNKNKLLAAMLMDYKSIFL